MYNRFSIKKISLLILLLPFFFFSCINHQFEYTDYDGLFEKDMVLVEGGWFVMGCLDPMRRMFQLCVVASDLKSDAKYYKDFQIHKNSVVESTKSL